MLAALPLQWFVIAGGAGVAPRLHQLVLVSFAALVIARYSARSFTPVLKSATLFTLANLYMITMSAVLNLYNGVSPVGSLEELVYLCSFVAVATFFYRAVIGKEHGAVALLRWSTAATVVTLLTALSVSMIINGVNPAQVLAQSVATADPRVLQEGIFKSSFTGFGFDEETVRGNLRHQVFGALLVSMYVSSWASRFLPFTTSSQHRAYRVAMIVSAILLALSLSRSIILAALLWPLIAFLRSVLTLSLTVRQIATAFVVFIGGATAFASGFGLVIWNRFTEDTGSYNARTATLSQVPSRISEHFWTGGADTGGGESSHNFILDSWLRGGIFVAIAASIVVLLIVVAWIALLARVHREPEWIIPVIAALGLPIVRMATQGGGLIGIVEWVALAFVAGLLTYRRRALFIDVHNASGDSGTDAPRGLSPALS
jgi:hypothetical protein